MKKVLVVPTNRPNLLVEFLKAWLPVADWDLTVIVFDGPDASELGELVDVAWGTDGVRIFDWGGIDREFGDDAWIISRKNAGIRSYGFLKAVQAGADVIATLDDDCYPVEGEAGLFEAHADAFYSTSQWTSSSLGMTPRGMPYRQRGVFGGNVMMNLGLWRNVGDWDAPHSLVNGADLQPFEPVCHQRLLPFGQYMPMSTMNWGFRHQALPLMYLPKMGQGVPYDRFDDIWGGIIAKKVCDHLGWYVSVGRPVVTHRRASDPFVNLQKEAAGIARNETFWHEIDGIRLGQGDNAAECMIAVAAALQTWDEDYFQTLGKAIERWVYRVTSSCS